MTTSISPHTADFATQTVSLPAGSDVLARAHELASTKVFGYDPDKFWEGLSDETVSGKDLAEYLQAVVKILTRDGWVRRYTNDTEVDLSGDIKTMNLITMARKAFALLREEYGFSSDKRLTLSDAMGQAIDEDAGDRDIRCVAGKVLSAILRASRGETEPSYWPIYDAWSEKHGRTQDEVMALLAAGAEFARTYGPAA